MKKAFQKIIDSRKFEDISIIRSIEKTILHKRGYIFNIPKPGTNVILLVSGGLDSILTWGYLLKEYKLRVFPLFLNKGEKRASKEEASVDFFADYYSTKSPELYVQPSKQTILLPQKEIVSQLKTPYDDLSTYAKKKTRGFDPSTTSNMFLGSPGIVPLYALLFARFIELTTQTKIRTIFSSVMLGDGTVCPSQTITSLRVINLAMCTFTDDYSWQFTSPSIEPYLDNYFEKKDLILWGTRNHIPMEKTWSCYRGLYYQCGTCLACVSRKYEFRKAHIPDKTKYMTNYAVILKQIIKRVVISIHKSLSD